ELETYIVMWDRYHPYVGEHLVYRYSDPMFGGRHALVDYDQCRYSPMMLFFARKAKTLPEIVIPLQFEGNYVAGGEVPAGEHGAHAKAPPHSEDSVTPQTSVTPPRSAKQRLAKLVLSAISRLPEEWAYSMNARLRRWRLLKHTRKASFRF
ncbi:MAG TPA: hypothetical protein VFQ61_13945, partial [Polyangiaceae bacterium]|nr:hypothetical protein [Polyangiaceae bacterium]